MMMTIFPQTLSRQDATSGVAFAVTMLGVRHSGPWGHTWEPFLRRPAGDTELHTHVPDRSISLFQ